MSGPTTRPTTGKQIEAIDPPNTFTGQVNGLAYQGKVARVTGTEPIILLDAPSNQGIYITRIDINLLAMGADMPLSQILTIGAGLTTTIKTPFLEHIVRRALDGIGIYDQPLPFITPPQSGVYVPANQNIIASALNNVVGANDYIDLFARIFYYI